MIYILPDAPQQSRGGIIMPVEGADIGDKRWVVTLTGLNGDHPPTDEVGFLRFARGLSTPEFAALFANAEPLSEPFGYRRASNRLYEYDKLPRYLEGLLATGDSVYALNPVYGQGMTLAALGAKTLQTVLMAHQTKHGPNALHGLAKSYQRKLARVIAGPWQLATGQDMRWPTAAAAHSTTRVERLIQRYLDEVFSTIPGDPIVAEAFFQVQNMLKPPTTLFHPAIAYRVWQNQRRVEQPNFEPATLAT